MHPQISSPSISDTRGQAGIGTLILFIVALLVAAAAATTFLNVAGMLQSQARQTGADSGSLLMNRVTVFAESGTVTTNVTGEKVINQIGVDVKPAAGAGDIDLDALTIQIMGPHGTLVYTHLPSDTTASNEVSLATNGQRFEIQNYRSPHPNQLDTVFTGADQRSELVIPLDVEDASGYTTSETADDALHPGDHITITILTGSGAKTIISIQIPDLSSTPAGGTLAL